MWLSPSIGDESFALFWFNHMESVNEGGWVVMFTHGDTLLHVIHAV